LEYIKSMIEIGYLYCDVIFIKYDDNYYFYGRMKCLPNLGLLYLITVETLVLKKLNKVN